MSVVLDASVIIKWLIRDPQREVGTENATALVEAVMDGRLPVCQPAHWLVEVGAVLVRLSPTTAVEDVLALGALNLPVTDDPEILQRACELAIDLNQHVFDTLYHAVALATPDFVLVTADSRYLRKAEQVGRIVSLMDWQLSE